MKAQALLPFDLPERVTIIEVDGNGIAAAALSRHGDTVKIEGLYHIELEKLVEVIERVNHPIFMNYNRAVYPELPLLAARLKDLFSDPVFQNPVLSIASADKTQISAITGPATEKDQSERRKRLIQAASPLNPMAYPSIFAVREEPRLDGTSTTVLLRARLLDILPVAVAIERSGQHYLGTVAAQTSASSILLAIAQGEEVTEPQMLCHLGKLRTLFTIGHPDGAFSHHDIPVGLARDDMHYFKSISPVTAQLNRLKIALGTLFFPPEVTPSPLFSGWASSPQIDCTRFAIQISHYTSRCIGISDPDEHIADSGTFYLSGRASRIIGLRQFLEMKVGVPFRRVDRRPLPGLELDPAFKWGDVGDNLLCVGAGLHVLNPRRETLGVLGQKFVSPPMDSKGRCSVKEIDNHTLYVFEQRAEFD